MERKKTVCFTGHRPEKLTASKDAVIYTLGNAIEQAYKDGYRIFISGMARGVDIWAAEIVLARKATNPEIRLICALPHPDFEKRWSAYWQMRYYAILQQADWIKTICPAFSWESYQLRNEWMIDHSARVIAIYNGASGGTAKTIDYAEKSGIEVWRYEAGPQ